MTHGAVIARAYGLPTVVGVENCYQAEQRWTINSRAWNRRGYRNIVKQQRINKKDEQDPHLLMDLNSSFLQL
ncbi:hypothetical protein PAV_9c00040 [Paenibacillus alvei DSM 29]|nr:hypothetical protein PAV_9c00040 [Paenibacillus alvei DSM 29]